MPMTSESHQKITAAHLSRTAYLYVRQSTLRQVLENTESTHRQYALRDRAVAMGWPLVSDDINPLLFAGEGAVLDSRG